MLKSDKNNCFAIAAAAVISTMVLAVFGKDGLRTIEMGGEKNALSYNEYYSALPFP